MKKDIKNRKDIEKLVRHFYGQVMKDPELSIYFSMVVQTDWDKHIPLMCDFWENALFHTGGYMGNPMAVHANIHFARNFSPESFEHWTGLFTKTIDTLYHGPNADALKLRAQNISTVMRIKILNRP